MSAHPRSIRSAALLIAAVSTAALPAESRLPSDGWVSWDVAALENAPAWCCFGRTDREGMPSSCKLDGHAANFGTRDHETTDTVTVYAHSSGGKLDRLQVLSATCPVESKTPIQEIDGVSPDDSARWLLAQVDTGSSRGGVSRGLVEYALAGLAVHRGEFARDALIRLGNTDETAELRSKAWFWLAITGAPGAEAPIAAAMRKDPDGGVREQAVFALSRLPDERATRALIAAAEDRSLSREQRKRAVFWLSQSESSAALAYLDKVLAASTSRK